MLALVAGHRDQLRVVMSAGERDLARARAHRVECGAELALAGALGQLRQRAAVGDYDQRAAGLPRDHRCELVVEHVADDQRTDDASTELEPAALDLERLVVGEPYARLLAV